MRSVERVIYEVTIGYSDVTSTGNHSIRVVPCHHRNEWSVPHYPPSTGECVHLSCHWTAWNGDVDCVYRNWNLRHRLLKSCYSVSYLHTQYWSTTSHWSSDVLRVDGSDWHPTGIVPSTSSPQWCQHQCALIGGPNPQRITTTEGSSSWCSPCTVHHHWTVHWWVQWDIT